MSAQKKCNKWVCMQPGVNPALRTEEQGLCAFHLKKEV